MLHAPQAPKDGRTNGRRDAQTPPETAASTPSRSALDSPLPCSQGGSLQMWMFLP